MRIRVVEVSKWRVSQATGRLVVMLVMLGVWSYGLASCSASKSKEGAAPAEGGMSSRSTEGFSRWCKDGGVPGADELTLSAAGSSTRDLCMNPNGKVRLSAQGCADTAEFTLGVDAGTNPSDAGFPIRVDAGLVGELRIKPNPAHRGPFGFSFNCTDALGRHWGTNNGTLEVATGGGTPEEEAPGKKR